MKEKIWLSSPHLSGEEQKYVKEAFDSNWVAPLGPNVNGFEREICAYTGAKACAALSSGTAAIHLALILLGVNEGDEVLCSTFTFSASVNPIRYQGAVPVFIDSESDTWNMCPIALEEAISDRIKNGKQPKAIILVHLYGMPSKMHELMAIANKYDIPIIEDAAEAIGSKYKGKAMGTFGEMGIYSFNGNKIITTSGGGALVSNEPHYCKEATFLATQARDAAPHYQHSKIGYNYRMSNILAGIGRGQLEVLNDRINSRRKNFEFYKEQLAQFKEVKTVNEPDGFFSNRWLTTILTDSYESRENIRMGLEKENIESRPVWKPMHLQPVFNSFPKYLNGVSETVFDRGLCLPSGSNLTDTQKDRVINTIKSVC
ncbi:MAG: aminotransferase class I/II-fold pyridoxal phosphate-dependent enzyme [Flavobacteriaceae bacterium]|nr:aminotransferase class I/II-fold pyridoxal phosphate-dependent enzyme [Flavobacteriaceae bacterium]